MKFVAFDLETGSSGESTGLDPRDGLGILCAALLPHGQSRPRLWYGGNQLPPRPRLTHTEAVALLEALEEYTRSGYHIVTWNGIGFDFHVLAVETGLYARCAQLAMEHVDLMFLFLCLEGHPLSLAAAAEACGTAKSPNLAGIEVPAYWESGRYAEVLEYLAQDVQATGHVASHLLQHRGFVWRTRSSGKLKAFRLPEEITGFEAMTVRRCLTLPPPGRRPAAQKERLRYVQWISGPFF